MRSPATNFIHITINNLPRLNLVKDAIADRQIAGVDEAHFLFVAVLEKTPLKVQQWSVHHDIRNNTPVDKEEERRREELRLCIMPNLKLIN